MADVPQQKSESAKSATALREEEVLALWKRERIFERSVEKDAPEGEFVFYDGPPFATGLPHMGHLLGSTIKDVVGRYKTMRGFRVERRWGWDCHGLPIENIVEKKLGLKSKKDIEALGVARFNEEARSTVLTYVAEWKAYVERLGRWVDFDRSYKTMDTSYIEAVWGALKKVHTDGRLYEGKKVLMYCPHCETPLAKAEIAMDNSYKDVTDEAVFVKFKLKSGNQKLGDVENAYILAWTTTPWTLPGNMALAVNPVETYVAVTIVDAKNDIRFQNGEVYVFMDGDVRRRLFGLFVPLEGSDGIFELDGTSHVTVKKKTIPGSDLVGLAYEPLYDIPQAREAANEKTWTVQAAEFVTTDEGTGVVHIAPMYGEDDYVLGKQLGLPMVELLNRSGTYNDAAPEFVRGQYFKKGSKEVLADLEARGLVFSKHPHTHSYPHCYRCSTALIYNALSSWFIDIQSAKDRLLEENETVSWYPEHLKHGRFRHTVESAPDWNVSRNRYWASPLPIWKHEHTGAVHVIGSVVELRAHTKTSGNRYLMVRHGQAQSNVQGVIRSRDDTDNHLTERGTEQVRTVALGLKASGITKIIASPLARTRETAELIAAELGISPEAIIFDERLREWQLGVLEGKPITDLRAAYPSHTDRFSTRVEGGENLTDMKRRVGEALYEYEQTYRNETILIVGHEYTLWLATCIAHGATVEECLTIRGTTPDYVANGELRELSFVPLPHNADYELDLHRPYIDTLELVAEDGARLVRIPEVVDCWVESGAMPVAAPHALGEALTQPTRYPGDFIAEYIAQTRTWFYYMHVLGVLLFDRASFTHCVTTGTVLAEDGSKMSKSKGNFTDPLVNINRYGADALRLYLMGSVVMAAEDMSFRDEELKDMHNRFIGILANTYAFYAMYASENAPGATQPKSEHVLDRWVRARLHETSLAVTEALEGYSTPRAVRELREFVADLSTWYLRRSRERLKGQEGEAAQEEALGTFREVLETLSLLLAPLAPFIAEEMYRGVGGGAASVHLADWPARARPTAEDAEVLTRMAHTRTMVSQALEARAKAGIKVRQPLASLTIPTGVEVYEELILDEVNIKSIVRGADLALDTTVTPELQREGEVRELTRLVQEQRKNEGREPHEQLVLEVTDRMPEETKELVSSASLELKRKAGITSVRYVLIAEPTSFELKGYEARLAKE